MIQHALEGAVSVNGKTVAVMPGGLDEICPKSNLKLAQKIVENEGCLISEYPYGTKTQKYMFVQRDRIQAMLSSKIFIIDSEKMVAQCTLPIMQQNFQKTCAEVKRKFISTLKITINEVAFTLIE